VVNYFKILDVTPRALQVFPSKQMLNEAKYMANQYKNPPKIYNLFNEILKSIGLVLYTTLLTLLCLSNSACKKPTIAQGPPLDVVLIGGGIMSATLGSMLTVIDPNLRIHVYEKLDALAKESSAAWNNAGTGHASYSELNYTPEINDKIDIKKAITVNAAFEISKQYWSYMIGKKKIPEAKNFINPVPHMSFVWGEKNLAYLKKRYDSLSKHPFFDGMEYSEDHETLKKWFPLIMKGRDPKQKLAATRMIGGTDVDFGTLTRNLFKSMETSPNNKIFLLHEVVDLVKNKDGSWRVIIKDLNKKSKKAIDTRFVFIGAGGGALKLLQKSNIPEAKGYGGFPVGGAWLVTENEELIKQHLGKVYGQAGVGSPPMSVPHLDTRYINGKRGLLFGPFATFSTKFLKQGSWFDLFSTVSFSNLVPMIQVGFRNFNLVSYLVGQVLMTQEQQLKSLKDYVPNARLEDWYLSKAGQRVQIIKKNPESGGILQFGTELVSSKDKSIVALLGASPGASTAAKIMLNVLEISFAEQLKNTWWKKKIKEMIPSYGQNLEENISLLESIRQHNAQMLGLKSEGFLMPDITP
jgi:malate dehydrogenase (quinone)